MAKISFICSKVNALVLLILILFSQNLWSQNSIKLKKASSEIILDGIIDEQAWEDVVP